MDKEFQTSFIPKKPLVEERASTRRPVGLLNFIVTIIFIGSIVAAGGAYAYELSLKKSVADMDAQLGLAREHFDDAAITEMQNLDKRLRASDQILSSHIMISPIFMALQSLTLKTVSYTRFDYKINTDAGKTKVEITMSGKATSYEAIALQSDSLAQNKYIKDPVFSNLNLDEKGRVTFDLSFIVDPTFINYKDTLNREGEVMDRATLPVGDVTENLIDTGIQNIGGTTSGSTGNTNNDLGVPLPGNLGGQ
jgi:hypothetical protein